mgnify:FL=1
MKFLNINWGSRLAAAVVVWGATAYHYINTGMSISMIAFTLFVIAYALKNHAIPKVTLHKNILWAFAVFYACLFISTLFHLDNTGNMYGGSYSFLSYVMIPLPLFMILYIGWEHDIRKTVCYTFVTIGYAICGYGIYEYAAKHMERLDSFYTSPPHVGIMMDVFIPLTIAFICYYRDNIFHLAVMSVLLVLEAVTLVLTQTRGAMGALSIAFFITVLIFLFRNQIAMGKTRRRLLGMGAGLLVVLALLCSLRFGIHDPYRMQGADRPFIWKSSYHMWEDHKLAGVGLNGWKNAYDHKYQLEGSREFKKNVHAHNTWLIFLSTGGILAFLGYNAYLILMGMYFWKRIRIYALNPFSWCMLAVFLAFVLNGLLDETFSSTSFGRLYYLAFGITLLFERWDTLHSEEKRV